MRRLALSLLLVIVAPAASASDAEVAAVVASAEPNLRPALPHELTLYPVAPQLNGKFSEHVGSALAYTYRVREGVGLQLLGQLNWAARTSSFNRELTDRVRQQGQAATLNLMRWGVTAGTEVVPARGTIQLGNTEFRYAGFLSGGVGVAGTRIFLRNDRETGAIYADSGLRPLAQAAIGMQAGLSERVTLRVEARNLFYSTRIEKLNGCTLGEIDPSAIGRDDWTPLRRGTTRYEPSTCRWEGVSEEDRMAARGHLTRSSSDVLNLLHLHAGLSVRF